MKFLRLITVVISCLISCNTVAYEISGNVSVETRLFNQNPLQPVQSQNNVSASFNPEFYTSWDDENTTLTIEPFLRVDYADKERTHFDFRKFVLYKNFNSWEIKAGVSKVFWGVTESLHLVDIINQTDAIENLDREEKLGQPMVNLSILNDWGNIDLFILPYFRTRTFAGIKGRLRPQAYIDNNNEVYESSKKEKHIDYAIRYEHTIDDWDIGISHFYGTSRTPGFIPGLDANGVPMLTPIYYLLRQTGLDLQYVVNDWLWKLEAIRKNINNETYNAYAFGFEYTLVGLAESNMDLGLISEYLYDTRINQLATFFQRDLMMGTRLSFNDTQSSDILLGVIIDLDNNERSYSLEASTRLTNNWKLNIEARVFSNSQPPSLLYGLRRDDYAQINLEYYF